MKQIIPYDVIEKIVETIDYEKGKGCARLDFMNGNCVYFAAMLKTLFPEAHIMLSTNDAHVAVKIGDFIYDVYGYILENCQNFIEINDEDLHFIDVALLPFDKNVRKNKDQEYTRQINKIIDLYYPDLIGNKILQNENLLDKIWNYKKDLKFLKTK